MATKKVKGEKDPDLERAMRLSLQEEKKAKSEKHSNVKAEQRIGVKTEPRVGVKAEQQVRVKAERGAAASASSGQQLPSMDVKLEQLRKLGTSKIKSELLRREEQDTSSIADLVKRGLQMRAKEQKVKREKGTSGKKRLFKVKKERCKTLCGKFRKKPRITAKRRKASREVMNREIALSEELGELLGADSLSRPEAVKQLWAYCRDNGMLNPENRREIIFDAKLEQMMGQKTASMMGLQGILTGHFDYTRPVVKLEAKQEPGSKSRSMKMEAKKEPQKTVKHEMKQEKSGASKCPVAQLLAKREQFAKSEVGSKRLKNEPSSSSSLGANQSAVEEVLATTVLQITSFDRTSVVVQCAAPPGRFQLEAVAKPDADKPEVRAPCVVEVREDRNGEFVPYAEAKLVGLDPKQAYHVTVQISGGGGCSHQALLPQRMSPSKWSPRDVAVWCQAQHVPELVRMAQNYAINGKTLLSLGEEDLKASGLAAPFLLRRTLEGLKGLRASGG